GENTPNITAFINKFNELANSNAANGLHAISGNFVANQLDTKLAEICADPNTQQARNDIHRKAHEQIAELQRQIEAERNRPAPPPKPAGVEHTIFKLLMLGVLASGAFLSRRRLAASR